MTEKNFDSSAITADALAEKVAQKVVDVTPKVDVPAQIEQKKEVSAEVTAELNQLKAEMKNLKLELSLPQSQLKFAHGEGEGQSVGSNINTRYGKTLRYKALSPGRRQLVDMLQGKEKSMTSEMEPAIFEKQASNRFGEKAINSSSGSGAEMIPTTWSRMIYERVLEISSVASIFEQMRLQTETTNLSNILQGVSVYYNDATDANPTESSPTTGETVVVARKFKGKTYIQDDTLQDTDSVINFLPILERKLAEGITWGWDDAIINGDRTSTHQDADTEAIANHPAKAWYGLRYYGLSDAALKEDFSTGNITTANLDKLLKALDRYYAGAPEKCAFLFGTKGLASLRALADFKTADKAGAKFNLFSGQVTAYMGAPIIYSTKLRENLNASGVYDGVTTTKGSNLLVRPDQFLFGTYKDITFEMDKDIESGTNKIVVTSRNSFNALETPTATVPTVALGFNWAE